MRPQRQEEEDEEEEMTRPVGASPSKADSGQAQQLLPATVDSRPRQLLPSYPTATQFPATSSLLLSPRSQTPDVHIDLATQSSTERRLRSALTALKDEQHEKAKVLVLLKAREEEINECHQLLWHSDVAPSQVSRRAIRERRRRTRLPIHLPYVKTLQKIVY